MKFLIPERLKRSSEPKGERTEQSESIIPRSNYLRIKVIPKSPTNEVTEIMKDDSGEPTIKIRIKAVPEKGKANAELIKFLSHELKLPKENIEIISGKSSAIKLLRIKWTSTTSR